METVLGLSLIVAYLYNAIYIIAIYLPKYACISSLLNKVILEYFTDQRILKKSDIECLISGNHVCVCHVAKG